MSENFAKAIISLLKENKIILTECEQLIYLVDGKALNLPLARGKEKDYKKTHWLPMAISHFVGS